MTRTLAEIKEQEELVISPEMVRSKQATLYRKGLMLSVYSYENPPHYTEPNVAGAVLWLWLALVATAAAVWWLERGNEAGVFLVGGMIGLVVYALAHVAKTAYQARHRDETRIVHVLNVSVGDEHGTTFLESTDKAEVDTVRAEIERVFALETA